MVQRIRKYPLGECSRRGEEIYRRLIRPTLNEADRGKYVAIDVDSEAYEIGTDDLRVCHVLLERFPEAQIFMVRAGFIAVDKLGGGPIPQEPLP